MIIERLDLHAYGMFTDASLDLSAGPYRFHLVYGPNEAGKSTTMRAITALLFGFPRAVDDNYLHRKDRLRVGGLLSNGSKQVLECIRRRGKTRTLRDADDREAVDEAIIRDMLGGIDRDTFCTRFALTHDDLVGSGAKILAGESDLGRILFAAGAGVARLREIEQQLVGAVKQRFLTRGTQPSINKALDEFKKQNKELKAAQVPPAQYDRLKNELAEKQNDVERLRQQLEACASELSRLKSLEEAAPIAAQWQHAISKWPELESVPELDDAFSERRRELENQRALVTSSLSQHQSRLTELQKQLKRLACDPDVLMYEPEIQTLYQQVATHDQQAVDRRRREQELESCEQAMAQSLREISIEVEKEAEDGCTRSIESAIQQLPQGDTIRKQIHDLANQYGALTTAQRHAQDRLEQAKQELSELDDELSQRQGVQDPTQISETLSAVGNPELLLDDAEQRRSSVARLRGECEASLHRLHGFSGDLETLVALTPPARSEIDRLRLRFENLARSMHEIDVRRAEKEGERREIASQLDRQQAEQALPTKQDLAQSRRSRDRMADQLIEDVGRGDVTKASVESLRDAIEESDRIADTMLSHHQAISERDSLRVRMRELDATLASLDDQQEKVEKEQKQIQQEWIALWDQCGVAAGTLEQMDRWLDEFDSICQLERQLREEQQKLEQADQRVAHAIRRLQMILSPQRDRQPVLLGTESMDGSSEFDDPALPDLYRSAIEYRNQCEQDWREYKALTDRVDHLRTRLPEAESQFETAQHDYLQWREQWSACIANLPVDGTHEVTHVLGVLDRIAELQRMMKQRDGYVDEIRRMDDEYVRFETVVRRIAESTNEPVRDTSSLDVTVQRLYQRLQAAKTAQQQHQSLTEQMDSIKQQLADAQVDKSAIDQSLEALCAEAGCKEVEQLPAVESRSRQRRELRKTLDDLESRLIRLSQGMSVDDFARAAVTKDSAVLQLEIDRLVKQHADLKQEYEQRLQEVGGLQNEIKRIDGGQIASDLFQEMQLKIGAIRHESAEYAKHQIALLLLRRAIDRYQSQHQDPVLAKAEQYFAQLTCHEYSGLKVDYNEKGMQTLYAVRANQGGDVPAVQLSTGTADSLYLAIRLASLHHQMDHDVSVPLVVDDCLVQLDDARAAAALSALSDLSQQTQVILFTHHRHLIDLAHQHLDEGHFHVHQLGVST